MRLEKTFLTVRDLMVFVCYFSNVRYILFTIVRPSPGLVSAVQAAVIQHDLNARFLVPIISGLNKEEVLASLPRIVSLLKGTERERRTVTDVFLKLLSGSSATAAGGPGANNNNNSGPGALVAAGQQNGAPAVQGGSSGNLARHDSSAGAAQAGSVSIQARGPVLSPSELLIQLHLMEDIVGWKAACEGNNHTLYSRTGVLHEHFVFGKLTSPPFFSSYCIDKLSDGHLLPPPRDLQIRNHCRRPATTPRHAQHPLTLHAHRHPSHHTLQEPHRIRQQYDPGPHDPKERLVPPRSLEGLCPMCENDATDKCKCDCQSATSTAQGGFSDGAVVEGVGRCVSEGKVFGTEGWWWCCQAVECA